MNGPEPSIALFLEITVVLVACRLVGRLARRVGQPRVVAEMLTGVLLGPSFFGLLAPEWQAWVFPPANVPMIYGLAQVGLVLYMFSVGLEFDHAWIRRGLTSAIVVSSVGILIPFALGAGLAVGLRGHFDLFTPAVGTLESAVFLGSALSITAFPMLARILSERGLSGTQLGALALAAGAIDDAAAWCLLAVMMASFTGQPSIALVAVGGTTLFAVLLLTVGRTALRRLYEGLARREHPEARLLPVTLALLVFAAWTTDRLGVYAVFGAFLLGVAFPREVRVAGQELLPGFLWSRITPLTTTLFLPLFFVHAGLKTSLSLIVSPAILGVTALVLLAAVAGKGLACAAAARLTGHTKSDALGIGALMNARGLMELILIDIAYERGAITQTLFTILVLVAVLTTWMAVPLFDWIQRRRPVTG